MPVTIPLRSMPLHGSGTITAVNASGELGRRIDMGLMPGVGRAPLKDPVALRLKGCTPALRNSEADLIMVELPQTLEAHV